MLAHAMSNANTTPVDATDHNAPDTDTARSKYRTRRPRFRRKHEREMSGSFESAIRMRALHTRMGRDKRLTLRDLKVLLTIGDLTLSWNRFWDYAFRDQLANASGVDRSHVGNALKRLASFGYITQRVVTPYVPRQIWLNPETTIPTDKSEQRMLAESIERRRSNCCFLGTLEIADEKLRALLGNEEEPPSPRATLAHGEHETATDLVVPNQHTEKSPCATLAQRDRSPCASVAPLPKEGLQTKEEEDTGEGARARLSVRTSRHGDTRKTPRPAPSSSASSLPDGHLLDRDGHRQSETRIEEEVEGGGRRLREAPEEATRETPVHAVSDTALPEKAFTEKVGGARAKDDQQLASCGAGSALEIYGSGSELGEVGNARPGRQQAEILLEIFAAALEQPLGPQCRASLVKPVSDCLTAFSVGQVLAGLGMWWEEGFLSPRQVEEWTVKCLRLGPVSETTGAVSEGRERMGAWRARRVAGADTGRLARRAASAVSLAGWAVQRKREIANAI